MTLILPDVMSVFAQTILDEKYAHELPNGRKERWPDVCRRVVPTVLHSVGAESDLVERLLYYTTTRKFLPGGRYLYATGLPFHQTQNCFLFRAGDSREGWAGLMQRSTLSLMTGGGIGVNYSLVRPEGSIIRKTRGRSTGPIALMQMVNESARWIRQGGNRRAAVWAGLNWRHDDIFKYIRLKDWSPEIRRLKAKDFNFPAPMDGTNISVGLDDEFFLAYRDAEHPLHKHAHQVYWETIKRMRKTGEPGFYINTGANAGEDLRNAPVAGETRVMTGSGYRRVDEIVGVPTTLWTGKRWATNVVFKRTQKNAPILKVKMTGGRTIRCEPSHEFLVERYCGAGQQLRRVAVERVAAQDLQRGDVLHVALPTDVPEYFDADAYTLGWLYGDGSFHAAGGADLSLCAEESKACAPYLTGYASENLCDGRGYHRFYFGVSERFRGREHYKFPEEILSRATTEQQASFLAGLWDADGNFDVCQHRVRLSNSSPEFLRDVARTLEQLGILAGVSKNGNSTYGKKQEWQLNVMSGSVRRFAEIIPTKRVKVEVSDSWKPYRASRIKVQSVTPDGYEDVYCCDVRCEEHSFQAEGVVISNCTEITSADDNDVCNLGSINMARISSLAEFADVVEAATAFLLAGTVYSLVPSPEIDEIRTKNRRLGLGLMGLHEWLLQRDRPYGPDEELAEYLEIYARNLDYAARYAREWNLTMPLKGRAIAPNGTIGIVAETTQGIEPITCVAKKRRYYDDEGHWRYQYVVDPAAQRAIDRGWDPDKIEDAYILAEDSKRRVGFQSWIQQYVDHGISSTINLPAWGTAQNDESSIEPFGNMLFEHLPSLRGITCYPDGARGGQPMVKVPYDFAMEHVGQVYFESGDVCELTKGGTCGD